MATRTALLVRPRPLASPPCLLVVCVRQRYGIPAGTWSPAPCLTAVAGRTRSAHAADTLASPSRRVSRGVPQLTTRPRRCVSVPPTACGASGWLQASLGWRRFLLSASPSGSPCSGESGEQLSWGVQVIRKARLCPS